MHSRISDSGISHSLVSLLLGKNRGTDQQAEVPCGCFESTEDPTLLIIQHRRGFPCPVVEQQHGLIQTLKPEHGPVHRQTLDHTVNRRGVRLRRDPLGSHHRTFLPSGVIDIGDPGEQAAHNGTCHPMPRSDDRVAGNLHGFVDELQLSHTISRTGPISDNKWNQAICKYATFSSGSKAMVGETSQLNTREG